MSNSSDENPFQGMKIKDFKVLDELEGRAVCPKCNKSRKYFCYTCYIPVPGLEQHVPKVKLPVKIDIIKHASEIDGKSTAAHAAVIAPDDVTIYTYPCIPDYSTDENVVLIFPGKNALSIQEYVDKSINESCGGEDVDSSEPLAKKPYTPVEVPISRAVFIDSTWNQSRGIYKDQRLREIPCVVIQSRISQFWRHQHGSPRWFLATIEAIHQFLVELHIICKLGFNNVTENAEQIKNIAPPEEDLGALELKSSISNSEGHKNPMTTSQSKTESDEYVERSSRPDKQPSKFVKNLALCRGIRSDSGGDPEINLCGPDQWVGKYGGDYDNLLFFFQFMYHKIHSIYDHDTLKSYKRDIV